MTPDELRALADEATPGPWTWPDMFVWGFSGPKIASLSEAKIPATDALLAALAPDLARLCAELGESAQRIVDCRYHTDGEAEFMLAKLSELEAR